MENATKNIVVGIADIKTGGSPDQITTNLGSCIGVCLYSQEKKVGGMLHLMMDYAGEKASKPDIKLAKYADTGIPELVKQMKSNFHLGPQDFNAKIFGGAKIIKTMTNEIGLDNREASVKILKELGIKIVAEKTGGERGCRITMDLSSGKVKCQIFGSEPEVF